MVEFRRPEIIDSSKIVHHALFPSEIWVQTPNNRNTAPQIRQSSPRGWRLRELWALDVIRIGILSSLVHEDNKPDRKLHEERLLVREARISRAVVRWDFQEDIVVEDVLGELVSRGRTFGSISRGSYCERSDWQGRDEWGHLRRLAIAGRGSPPKNYLFKPSLWGTLQYLIHNHANFSKFLYHQMENLSVDYQKCIASLSYVKLTCLYLPSKLRSLVQIHSIKMVTI